MPSTSTTSKAGRPGQPLSMGARPASVDDLVAVTDLYRRSAPLGLAMAHGQRPPDELIVDMRHCSVPVRGSWVCPITLAYLRPCDVAQRFVKMANCATP